MHEECNEGRLCPLTVYLVQEEADRIRDLADREGVSASHYLRQKLKRLLPPGVGCADNNGADVSAELRRD